MDPARVAELERRLEHRFQNQELLARALTHASYVNEHSPLDDNEGLAWLGDAALALVVAEHLFATDPRAPVGVMTPERAGIVSGANLARWASGLELGALLRLGRGEEQTGGRQRESVLATALEAILGVLFLEGGLDTVRRAVRRLAVW